MSDADLFAPEGGWRVRILDLSGGNAADDNVVDEIGGFPTLMHANAFARAYVRDSVEICRAAGMQRAEVLQSWFAFGEDAVVIDAEDRGWRSAAELDDFAERPSGAVERDWRSLDPRREDEGDDEDDDEDAPGHTGQDG